MAGTIPKASPSTVSEIVRQIKNEFRIKPASVRFFWPEEANADLVIALLP